MSSLSYKLMELDPGHRFVEYPKIANGVKQSFIQMLGIKGLRDPSIIWVAMEKVHGSNFGFVCHRAAPNLIRMQRRGALLGETDKFFGAQQDAGIQAIAAKVAELKASFFPSATQLTLYGELYGRGVQKFHYSTQLHFVCFDILVDDTFLAYAEMETLCRANTIPYAETLGEGSLDVMLGAFNLETLVSAYPAKHNAVIPGKPTIAEGIVLRPKASSHTLSHSSDEDRPIIKLKRAAFQERSAKGVALEASREEDIALASALQFVTEVRLTNVRSKHLGDALPHIIALALAADAMEDVKHEDFWIELDMEGARKKIQRAVTNAAFALVKRPRKE